MKGAIALSGIGKAYRQYDAPRDRLFEWISLGSVKRHRSRWALRDITLEMEPGESVGVIGANGAGKSTLLKVITGTTRPTTGQLSVDGRVAALLELGIGFHPDVTGRDNVLIAGQLLGFTAAEIALNSGVPAFPSRSKSADSTVVTTAPTSRHSASPACRSSSVLESTASESKNGWNCCSAKSRAL